MTKLFDSISRIITSLSAVVFVMLMTVTGMIFFSHTLFLAVFPDTMSWWEKFLATWVLALAWEFTVLITTVNARHINRHIPAVMAISSGIIILFFLRAFDGDAGALILTQRWFVGILVATINFIYAELFYKKWTERMALIQKPDELQQLHADLQQARARVQQLEAKQQQHAAAEHELKRLRQFHEQTLKELTCPHCGTAQPSYGSLNAHKGHCKKWNLKNTPD